MHAAIKEGDVGSVRRLLREGAHPNQLVEGGWITVFQAAVKAGNCEIVKTLIDSGADVNDGFPLREAVLTGKIDIINELLKSHLINVNMSSKYDKVTVLHHAVQNGDSRIVRMLLRARGIDVNARDEQWGCTPLHYSTNRKLLKSGRLDKDVVEALLAFHGTNIRIVNKAGFGARAYLEEGDDDIDKMFLEKGADVCERYALSNPERQLMDAIRSGRVDAARQAIRRAEDLGQRLNGVDHEGNTALCLALQGDQASTFVRMLIDYPQMDVNLAPTVKNFQGQENTMLPPLVHAVRKGDGDCVLMLLAAGADVHVRFLGGRTILCVVQHGNADLVDLLVHFGAEVNARDDAGNSVLHVLVRGHNMRGEADVVKRLLANGADARDDSVGTTLLCLAVQQFNVDLVRALLDHGCDINERGRGENSRTPLMYAVLNNALHIIHLLVSRNADETVTVTSKEGDLLTALDMSSNGRTKRYLKNLLERREQLRFEHLHGSRRLAFMMLRHPRLGAAASESYRHIDTDILRRIADADNGGEGGDEPREYDLPGDYDDIDSDDDGII